MGKQKRPSKETAIAKPDAWIPAEIRNPKQRAFLLAYSICATITHAADAAGITRQAHHKWLKEDAAYAEAAAEAKQRGNDALIAEARERAMKGVREPVYYQGQVVGWKWVKDTTLLIFLMKGAMPETYRDNVHVEGEQKVTLEMLVAGSMPPPKPTTVTQVLKP